MRYAKTLQYPEKIVTTKIRLHHFRPLLRCLLDNMERKNWDESRRLLLALKQLF